MAVKPKAETPARVAKPRAQRKSPQSDAAQTEAAVMAPAELDEDGGASATEKKASRGGSVLKTKDLIDQVTLSSGAKKKDVKSIVEATLVQIGAALGRGETLSLTGLGHLRVARKATEESPVATLKLRLTEGGKGKGKTADADEKDTLADDFDQG